MCFYGVDTAAIHRDESLLPHSQFKKIGSILRILEFFVAVVTFLWSVSRSSPYFFAVFDFFRAFLCRLYLLVVNHHFVFLLGNAIIVVLFVKFCRFACDDISAAADGDAFSEDEYLIGKVVCAPHLEVACRDTPPFQEIVYDEKLVKEVASAAAISRSPRKSEMKRSQSHPAKPEKIQLPRSKTEPRRKTNNSGGESASYKADDLSNEEFQQKVEAFIEQHQQFLRQESFSIVSG